MIFTYTFFGKHCKLFLHDSNLNLQYLPCLAYCKKLRFKAVLFHETSLIHQYIYKDEHLFAVPEQIY